jgi:hypothetical protein
MRQQTQKTKKSKNQKITRKVRCGWEQKTQQHSKNFCKEKKQKTPVEEVLLTKPQ